MKRSKKTVLILLGAILLALAAGAVCIGLRVAPTVNHALRISELLQPVMDGKNQTMRIATALELGGSILELESDVYLVTEDGTAYLALEQDRNALYLSGDVLFLENGKAFRIGDDLQRQTASYGNLLSHIRMLYETLKITAEETDGQTVYSVTVTAEQASLLLEAASLGEALPTEGIRQLRLNLAEKNGKLDHITFSGSGNADGAALHLHVTVSGFRSLAPGDYPIPEAVKHSAATVNRAELFSLTEDLYRLISALAPLADMESIEGTLALRADCGPLQLDTQMALSDLQGASGGQLDPEALRELPEILGFLCMEGDISCESQGDQWEYTLALDQPAMQELARMILPELAGYGSGLSKGQVSIFLADRAVTSMTVSLSGELSVLFARVPVSVCAEFSFHSGK